LKASDEFTASPDGVPSRALKKFHSQLLEKALQSLFVQTVNERDSSAMILSIDHRQIPEARAAIRKFRRDFDAKFGKASEKDRVYCLSAHFFRLNEGTVE
jgi:uncharacterized protein (TIGR02147 family)